MVVINQQYLNKLHDDVVKKYDKQKGVDPKKIQAKLNTLYRKIQQYKNGPSTQSLIGAYYQSFISALEKQNVDFATFLNYSNQSIKGQGAQKQGLDFEKQLEQFLKAIFFQDSNGVTSVGGQKAQTGFFEIDTASFFQKKDKGTYFIVDNMLLLVEDKAQKVLRLSVEQLRLELQKGTLGDNGKIKIAVSPGTQKTDIAISTNTNALFPELDFLKQNNVSLKNYADITNIEIDSSNYFRVVSSIFDVLNRTNEIASFYKSTVFISNKHVSELSKEKLKHKNHLKFVYGLTGTGQYYSKDNGGLVNLNEVNFLIVFDKTQQGLNGNPFYVLSVPNMLNKYFNNNFGFGNTINLNNFLTK